MFFVEQMHEKRKVSIISETINLRSMQVAKVYRRLLKINKYPSECVHVEVNSAIDILTRIPDERIAEFVKTVKQIDLV